MTIPPDANHSEARQAPQGLTANLGDDPVGVGDLVYVSVTGSPEFTRSYRVSNDGTISLPLVSEPISIIGMVPAAIAHTVGEALVRDRILVAPIVSVSVLEYRSLQVTVAGAVKSPTIIPATGDLKLLDAVARAQGFSSDAGPTVIVSSVDKATGTRTPTEISIKELLAGKNPALNVSLRGGEEIRVPDAAKMFVTGNVRAPGAYRINDSEGLSVMKVMALAQGTLPYTTSTAYVYRVVPGSSQRKEIEIPLRSIMHRKSPDIQFQANDILYVPESSKAHTAKLFEHLAGFSESLGAGLILRP
jgi:polysaccharide export outer membrane protein